MATYSANLALVKHTPSEQGVSPSNELVTDSIDWALSHGMSFKTSEGFARHVPFSLSAANVSKESFAFIKTAAAIMARLIEAILSDTNFIEQAITPVAKTDRFFAALLQMYQEIHATETSAKRLPLLILRSDFMQDNQLGVKLVEFNSIAAGMGPFGEKIHQLHRYIYQNYLHDQRPTNKGAANLVSNQAIEQLSQAIAQASFKIKREFNDEGPASFLMIVQENEDNVFDQHLLEYALKNLRIKTYRRTLSELVNQLETGAEQRLLLKGVGPIDTIYWRTGYQFSDYKLDLTSEQKCCQRAVALRVFIEQHRVAVNATVAQQLATSKRVQMLLANMSVKSLEGYGLSEQEAKIVKATLGDILPVNELTIQGLTGVDLIKAKFQNWVLKNQGEGGGHCIFDAKILEKLKTLPPNEYPIWSLMRKISPKIDSEASYIVKDGKLSCVTDLVSEIGLFTVLIDGIPADKEQGYAGYLVRSKSARSTEGGVHSGEGVLNSLYYKV